MDEQSEPDAVACPECGADPVPDPEHRLSALGYLHDDIVYECSDPDCGAEWTHGVPAGDYDDEPDLADDLECGSCGEWALVHRIEPESGAATLHLKCPECYHFWTVRRETGAGEKILVGYPQLTGQTKGAQPDGY